MIKKLYKNALALAAVSIVIAALGGCMTLETPGTPRGDVPASRIFNRAIIDPAAGRNQITVTRDTGIMGGGDFLTFSVNYVVLADLKPGESVSAWLPDGTYTFSVEPNPNPQSLVAPRSIDLQLQGGKSRSIRIGGNIYGTLIAPDGSGESLPKK